MKAKLQSRSTNRPFNRQVLECASPLALSLRWLSLRRSSQTQNRKRQRTGALLTFLTVLTLSSAIPPAHATERFWTNSAGGVFTSNVNWFGLAVPGVADNANFTNNANYQIRWIVSTNTANARFNASSGTVTQTINSFTWLLTNSYVVGQNAGAAASVTHSNGTLRVTNAAGAAALIVGQGGKGTYTLRGGEVVTDLLFVTNNGPAATNSIYNFDFGALTTLHGSTITQAANFSIGAVSNATATWNVLGGTNRVSLGSGSVLLGSVVGAGGELKVSGVSTVWTNSGDLIVGDDGDSCLLVVSNGAKVFNFAAVLGNSGNASNNQASVTGVGSTWSNSSSLIVGTFGSFNQLVISNGGSVFDTRGTVGEQTSSRSNAAFVTGSGSVWSNSDLLEVGLSSFNQLVVSNGGRVFSPTGIIGSNPDSSNSSVVVTGTNSVWTNSSEMYVGSGGSFNQLIVSNSGRVFSEYAYIGVDTTTESNSLVVAGTNSLLNAGDLRVGLSGSFNWLVVSNGGTAASQFAVVGNDAGNGNMAIITGAGSVWTNSAFMEVGSGSSFSQLMVSNGGKVFCGQGSIGANDGSNNSVIVSGPGSVWRTSSGLDVGVNGSFSQLMISDNGAVLADSLTLGSQSTSTNNRCVVDGGTLGVTNASASAVLDVRRGTNLLSSGVIEADTLRMTSTVGLFEFNGGTLNVRASTVANAQPFFVGNGTNVATFNLLGNGAHSFANGLTIRSNAWLIGNGAIGGVLTTKPGGSLSPGMSIGKLVLSNSPSLQGATLMEISKNGSTLTNDQVQLLSGTLTYGGTLTVTKIGPTDLGVGDRFPLFSASSYAGIFSSITLPPLGSGLAWRNNLLLDGSIAAVVAPRFSSLKLSGTNLVFTGTNGPANGNYYVLSSTNLALPISGWTPVLTNQFDGSGNFVFTNAISLAVRQRFYVLQVP